MSQANWIKRFFKQFIDSVINHVMTELFSSLIYNCKAGALGVLIGPFKLHYYCKTVLGNQNVLLLGLRQTGYYLV